MDSRGDMINGRFRFWFTTIFFSSIVLAWIASYWAAHLFCVTDLGGNTWVISCSDGVMGFSKCRFQKQSIWGAPQAQFGFRSIEHWAGRRPNVPVGLFVYSWFGSGPLEYQLDRQSVSCTSFAGFGSRSGVIASSLAVWIKCDEFFVPFWAIFPFVAIPFGLALRRAIALRSQRKESEKAMTFLRAL